MNNISPSDSVYPHKLGGVSGISIKEYFSALAMQAICSQRITPPTEIECQYIARSAVMMANTLIKELNSK